MATYTPNYNLTKPDSNDLFELFRQWYNANLDIIDANLGGGGGGDTVTWTQITSSGTIIAEISINGVPQNVFAPNGGGGGGGITTIQIYTGKESQYHSDSPDTPMEFDIRTDGADFSTYLSTSDHKTFTALQTFMAIITYGIEQDPNQSSSNSPNCSFFLNDQKVARVETPSSASGSNAIRAMMVFINQGDTFFWGSDDTRGWAVRLGQVDVLDGYDFSNYSKPSF